VGRLLGYQDEARPGTMRNPAHRPGCLATQQRIVIDQRNGSAHGAHSIGLSLKMRVNARRAERITAE
jgi:hypothetical protein